MTTRTSRPPAGDKRKCRVALYLDLEYGFARQMLQGIVRYSRAHGPWKCLLQPAGSPSAGAGHVAERFDAAIIGMPHRPTIEQLHAGGRPVVSTTSGILDQPFARVWPHNEAAGRLAATHFMELGFRQFAYVGQSARGFSQLRHRGFEHALNRAGLSCDDLTDTFEAVTARKGGEEAVKALRMRLAELGKPLAVLTATEWVAWTLVGMSLEAGIDVPEQMAVMAVGNDPLICEVCDIPLSGVELNFGRVGYEAAAMLHRLLDGEKAPLEPVHVAPQRVVTRQSSDILAIDEPYVAQALRLIHQRACNRLTVDEILHAVPVNRRWLERRFRDLLGRTVHQQITHTRMARARQLLAESDLKMPDVAERCGFDHVQHFGKVFRETVGQTPAAYRRAHRFAGANLQHITTINTPDSG